MLQHVNRTHAKRYTKFEIVYFFASPCCFHTPPAKKREKNTRPFAAGRVPKSIHINLEGVVTTYYKIETLMLYDRSMKYILNFNQTIVCRAANVPQTCACPCEADGRLQARPDLRHVLQS